MDICECGLKMMDPTGPKDAQILIVGDKPDYDDLMKNMPYVSKRGDVLRSELQRVGIEIRKCRITYVWRHEIKKECKGQLGDVLREMKDHPYVLLVGAETTRAFGLGDIDKIVGLQVESIFFPQEVQYVTVVTNPPQSSAIGDFRLAIEKFKRRLDDAGR